LGNTVIITNDQFGADIFHDNRVVSLPSWPTEVVDPTGAGDTFACAFLLHFVATKNQVDSAIYAHCAASLVIEQRGMDYTGMTLKIEERMAAYKKKYNY
jgi:sugar/nucleoside kinase (ribokinase family)